MVTIRTLQICLQNQSNAYKVVFQINGDGWYIYSHLPFFDRDGSLHVSCSEPMSGKEESITIEAH